MCYINIHILDYYLCAKVEQVLDQNKYPVQIMYEYHHQLCCLHPLNPLQSLH